MLLDLEALAVTRVLNQPLIQSGQPTISANACWAEVSRSLSNLDTAGLTDR